MGKKEKLSLVNLDVTRLRTAFSTETAALIFGASNVISIIEGGGRVRASGAGVSVRVYRQITGNHIYCLSIVRPFSRVKIFGVKLTC